MMEVERNLKYMQDSIASQFCKLDGNVIRLLTNLQIQSNANRNKIRNDILQIRYVISNELVEENNSLLDRVKKLESRLIDIERSNNICQQNTRNGSLEFDGIPQWVKDEELIPTIVKMINALNIPCKDDDIHVAYRGTSQRSPKPTIIKAERNLLEKIVAKRKVLYKAAKECRFPRHTKIFVNDHLSPGINKLAYNCRLLRKEKLIADTWCLNGVLKMRLLSNDIITVQHETDVYKCFPEFDKFTFDREFCRFAVSSSHMVEDNGNEDERDNTSMPYRHGGGGLVKKFDYNTTQGCSLYEKSFSLLQNDFIEANSLDNTLNNIVNIDDGVRVYPMKRSVSCTSCLLCGSSSARAREIDDVLGGGGVGGGMKKVASCSMCNWDVDDNKWSDDGESNLLSSDEINHGSSDEETQSSSDENDEIQFNDADIEQNEPDEYGCDLEEGGGNGFDCQFKSENFYTTNEIETYERYIDTSLSRTSPDGGECDDSMCDFDENRRHFKLTSEIDVTLTKDNICETSENESDNSKKEPHRTSPLNRRNTKKHNKKTKSKHCISLDRIASDELDEIFGRIQRHKTTVYESDADSEHNFIFRPITRTKKTKRKTKMKKYRSVEDLSSKECSLPLGVLSRSQSSLELSKLMDVDTTSSTKELLIAMDEQGLHERWVEYLHTIGGLKTFVGNKSLRYIWQQIMLFHEDLQQPLEEFLKTNLEKSRQFFRSYQELEEAVEQKAEQQEKETAKIYNDFEQTLQREKDQLQKAFSEKEEVARKESHKVVHSKQQEIETLVQLNSALNDRIKQLELVNEELKVNKEKMDSQFSHLAGTHTQLTKENETLNEVNNTLAEKMNFYDLILKEQEEHAGSVNKQYETIKEKYRETKHLNHGLSEENEYMKLTVSNLTTEVDDLKARNKLLQERTTTVPTHANYLCNSDDHGDYYFDNSYNDELNDVVPQHLNSTFNSKQNSLMAEVSPFLVESSPIKSVTMNFNKSLLNVPNRTPPASVRRQPQVRNTSVPPGKIRLASSKQTDFKVIFTGDANVGKTSLIRRICHGKFRPSREVTYESECSTKELEYNNQKLKLKLWDTLGQERFNSIPPSYFRKSDIVILMYDIAEEGSFINAKTWIRTIHDYTNENIFILLVASKSDLHHKRKVPSKKGQELATNNDAIFIETSAKTGENIQLLCQTIASTLLSREETVFIRKDFESSLCSLSYSMSHHNAGRTTNCCA